jgi:hypothetical protein
VTFGWLKSALGLLWSLPPREVVFRVEHVRRLPPDQGGGWDVSGGGWGIRVHDGTQVPRAGAWVSVRLGAGPDGGDVLDVPPGDRDPDP